MGEARTTAWRFFEEQDRLRGGPADDLCGDGYTAHLASFPPMGLDGHKGFAAAFYQAFPDMKHTLREAVADGDHVALRFVITGTNTESFMGGPATGKAIELEVISLVTVADGKVTELRSQFDQMGLLQQLGMAPGQ